MNPTPWPDPRLMERLTARIRSRDGSVASWIAGGEALAMVLVATRGEGGELPLWADDLADTMVGALLRVLDRSVDQSSVEQRVKLGLAAVALSVARPHCTSVLDGAVDAWLGFWTPEPPEAHHGEEILSAWTLLNLLRGNHDGAAHTAWTLAEVDRTGMGMILHDWAVLRIQDRGPEAEGQCFHALRAALARSGAHRPGMLLCAAALTVTAAGGKRREVLPWLDKVARELERDGTARSTPRTVGRRGTR